MITTNPITSRDQFNTELSSSQSLSQLYKTGVTLYQKTEDDHQTSSSDATYQSCVQDAISAFRLLSSRMTVLGLFSSNETVEEISTSHLKFILVDAYLGESLLKQTTRSGQERKGILNSAESSLRSFLSLVRTYGILPEKTAQLYNKRIESILSCESKSQVDEDGQLRSRPAPITAPNLHPAQLREQKIAAFKLEKETKAKLKEWNEKLVARSNKNGTAVEDDVDDDDDLQRQVILAMISLMTQKVVQSIQMIHEELEILEYAESRKRSEQETRQLPSSSESRQRDGNDTRLDGVADRSRLHEYSGPLLNKEGRPLRPFVITSKREDIAKGVFQYGHNLPTMTIDEYLQREMERGNFLSGGTEPPSKKEIDDQDYDALDEETMKQREWDDFKDDNPRGWGNRHRKG